MRSAKIEFYLLGTPELRRAGQPVNFDTRKALALLAYLVVNERSLSRDTLAAFLWAELDQSNARASLRRTLSTLNKGLAGMGLSIERETLGLALETSFWADITEFNHNLKTVKAQLHRDRKINPDSVSWLEAAVALWRGEFMQGFSLRDSAEFEEWQSQVAENVRREVSWALEKLVGYYAASHTFDRALDYTRRGWRWTRSMRRLIARQCNSTPGTGRFLWLLSNTRSVFKFWSANWEYRPLKPRPRYMRLLRNAVWPNVPPK